MTKKIIDKKTLERLAELARIDMEAPTPKRGRGPDRSVGKKLLNDLEKVLEYFEELKSVDTEGIEPMAGGTTQRNVFREDNQSVKIPISMEKLVKQFPEEENGFLKVPAVFSVEGEE